MAWSKLVRLLDKKAVCDQFVGLGVILDYTEESKGSWGVATKRSVHVNGCVQCLSLEGRLRIFIGDLVVSDSAENGGKAFKLEETRVFDLPIQESEKDQSGWQLADYQKDPPLLKLEKGEGNLLLISSRIKRGESIPNWPV